MDCKHCGHKSEGQAEFAAHCEEHENIQQRLNRTGLRTYGARYTEPEPAKGTQESSTSGQPQRRAENERVLQHRPKAVPAQASTTDSASTTEDIRTDALSKRVQAIVRRFPAYQGDGIEPQQEQPPREIPCPDCDAKFRNQQEFDAHFLSLYCRGNDILQYCLGADSSQPRGYLVEEVRVPFDHHQHGSLFQCRKCDSAFPILAEKEEHELTHPVLPQKCLHCAKVFGTKYELETHYEWHDDMEYRQMVDRLPLPDQKEHQSEQPEVTSDVFQLPGGIRKVPMPFAIGKKNRPKDKVVLGISSVSLEDVEHRFAPRGVFVGGPTHGYFLPPDMSEEEGSSIVNSHHDSKDVPMLFTPDGRVIRVRTATAPEVTSGRQSHPLASAAASDLSNPGTEDVHGCHLWCHGSAKLGSQVRDVSGRLRWLGGKAYGTVASFIINDPPFQQELEEQVGAAVKWETDGDLERALVSWKRVAELLAHPSNVERDKDLVTLGQLAHLSSKLGRFDEAVRYYCDALDLCEKLFGIACITNFSIINALGVLFDEKGDYQQAAPLYRRSLAGRLSILGPDHPDTLMSTQELGMANHQLGHLLAARRLIETACLGYENLTPPEERMSLMTLNNLASIYGSLGLKKEAAALLAPRIPQLRQSLGLNDRLVAFAVFNLLQNHQSPTIPADVLGIIHELRGLESEEGITASQELAGFFATHQRYKDALPLYREVVQRWKRRQGNQNDVAYQRLTNATALLARYLLRLHLYQEAEAAYGELARLATGVAALRGWQASATATAAMARRKREALDGERRRWRLDEPGPCPCGQPTTRLCPVCQTKRLCSAACDRSHHSPGATPAAGPCIPSVTPEQSTMAYLEPDYPAPSVERWFQSLFATDDELIRRSNSAGAPRLRSSRGLFVPATPGRCFATLRIKKDPACLAGYWFNPRCAAADVRVRFSGTQALGWTTPAAMRATYLFPTDDSAEMMYLVVAPGRAAVAAARREREAVTGVGSSGGEEEVPDSDMIEYLQLVEPDSEVGEPFSLLAILLEWEV